MEWKVYYSNFSDDKICEFNIFDHTSFYNAVKMHAKKCKSYEEFSKELKSSLMYYFWCKSEYEIILKPWIVRDADKKEVKIDMYDQVMLNWPVFLDYVWNRRNEL